MKSVRYGYEIDIPVLLIFFNRPEQTARVFERIRQARPSKLYLYQDGARRGRLDDIANVEKCREVVGEIDWLCEVHHLYQEQNLGCDPSEYLSQKWMFQSEKMGVILEDDDVPSLSFFRYCKELLEKYSDDERVYMICGTNSCEIYEASPYDYMFSQIGPITGWATWKRVVDEWQSRVPWLDDPYTVRQVLDRYKGALDIRRVLKGFRNNNNSGVAHYETILGASGLVNNQLAVIPKKNMISNIGVAAGATHSVTSVDMLPKGIRRIFNMKTYELEFPLKHPPYVLEDVRYRKAYFRRMGRGRPLIRLYRRLAGIILRVRLGGFGELRRLIGKRIGRQELKL